MDPETLKSKARRGRLNMPPPPPPLHILPGGDAIKAGDVVIRKVENGYIVIAMGAPSSEPKIYIADDATTLADVMKLAIVTERVTR